MTKGISRLGHAAPVLVGLLLLSLWEEIVFLRAIPPYILPAPSLILTRLVADWSILGPSLWFTLKTTLLALGLAIAGGTGLAVLFAQFPLLARIFYPYAVILQVTPIVSIAPLIIIWVDNTVVALLICAWIVAFFPILSNTSQGLASADRGLGDLFTLYRASRWQRLRHLLIPTALPYFLGGLRVSGGLALIGAVVAEFVAGAGGRESGLAYRILEAGYRLDIARMFAALTLVALLGMTIYGVLSALTRLCLAPWHESMRAPQE